MQNFKSLFYKFRVILFGIYCFSGSCEPATKSQDIPKATKSIPSTSGLPTFPSNVSVHKIEETPSTESIGIEESENKAAISDHKSASTESTSPDSSTFTPPSFTEKQPHGGPSGIPNLGNTCWMNAALQVVAALYADKITDPILKSVVSSINEGIRSIPPDRIQQLRQTMFDRMHRNNPNCDRYLLDNRQHDARCFLQDLNQYFGQFMYLSKLESIFNERLDYIPFCYLMDWSTTVTRQSPVVDPTKIRCLPTIVPVFYQYHQSLNPSPSILFDVTLSADAFVDPRVGAQSMKLRAAIVHRGSSMHSGHYISYIQKGGKWYHCSDGSVTEVEPSAMDVSGSLRVIFFYETAGVDIQKSQQPYDVASIKDDLILPLPVFDAKTKARLYDCIEDITKSSPDDYNINRVFKRYINNPSMNQIFKISYYLAYCLDDMHRLQEEASIEIHSDDNDDTNQYASIVDTGFIGSLSKTCIMHKVNGAPRTKTHAPSTIKLHHSHFLDPNQVGKVLELVACIYNDGLGEYITCVQHKDGKRWSLIKDYRLIIEDLEHLLLHIGTNEALYFYRVK